MLRNKPVRGAGADLLDHPTYSLPEAARFLGVPVRTMQYWFSEHYSILTPSHRMGDVALLSFRDLAEAYTLELLRTYYGFRLHKLREVMHNFQKETKLARPLLDADLYVVLSNIVLKKPSSGRKPREVVDLESRNLVFPELVQMIGHRVLRDQKRSPYRIYPWRLASPSDSSTPVTIDPNILSGRLVVTGTRIPVTVIQGMKLRGKTSVQIAKSYSLSVSAVEKALLHIERPISKKAA